MNRIKLFLVLAGFLLIIYAGIAHASQGTQVVPNFYFETTKVSLLPGNTIHISLTAHNPTQQTQCAEFYGNTNYNEISITPAVHETCLAPNQKQTSSVSIKATENASFGQYTARVSMETEGHATVTQTINVNIYNPNNFELNPLKSNFEFCKEGYTKHAEIEVINLSNESKVLHLTADSEMFAPAFIPSQIRLQSGERKTVKLQININKTTPLGQYSVPIYAKDSENNTYIQRTVNFLIKDCETESVPFTLELLNEQVYLEKGKSTSIEFEVTNLTEKRTEVFFMLNAGLQAELEKTKTVLEAYETKKFFIDIHAKENEMPGEKRIILYAYNNKHEEKRTGTVHVSKKHETTAVLVNEEITQRICSVEELEVFEVKVTNTGDYREKIILRENNPYYYIGVQYTANNFYLEKGETKTVYITVSPSIEATEGNKEINVSVHASNKRIALLSLSFTVIQKETGMNTKGIGIEIVSFPETIELFAEEKIPVMVEIKNTSNRTLTNVEVTLWGAQGKIFFEPQEIDFIPAGETRIIYAELFADNSAAGKIFEVTIEAKSGNYIDTQKLYVTVSGKETGETENETENETGFLPIAGYVGFLGDLGSKNVIATILMIFLGIILLSLLARSQKSGFSRRLVSKKRRETNA
jgi:uncharacterized membrane protein